MSLDVNGFTDIIDGGEVIIKVEQDHRLLKLARNLPWDAMLEAILPDLQRTERKCWWMGRPLRIRIHLGAYILQQMFHFTDRAAEQHVRENAVFRLFCGRNQTLILCDIGGGFKCSRDCVRLTVLTSSRRLTAAKSSRAF